MSIPTIYCCVTTGYAYALRTDFKQKYALSYNYKSITADVLPKENVSYANLFGASCHLAFDHDTLYLQITYNVFDQNHRPSMDRPEFQEIVIQK